MSDSRQRVLVAGIGNIFLGDDGFGVEVVRRLAARQFPDSVYIRDFGIRGFDVAYALTEAWDTVVLVDAMSRGETPGTVFVLEANCDSPEMHLPSDIQPHGMDPVQAIRLAKSLGTIPCRILVVGCEPADLGGEDGKMGLSPEIEAAVLVAADTVGQLVSDALSLTPQV